MTGSHISVLSPTTPTLITCGTFVSAFLEQPANRTAAASTALPISFTDSFFSIEYLLYISYMRSLMFRFLYQYITQFLQCHHNHQQNQDSNIGYVHLIALVSVPDGKVSQTATAYCSGHCRQANETYRSDNRDTHKAGNTFAQIYAENNACGRTAHRLRCFHKIRAYVRKYRFNLP